MGDGFLQLYKRLEAGSLSWPRTSEEAADLTEEQFRYSYDGAESPEPQSQGSNTAKAHLIFVQNIDFLCLLSRSDPFPVLQPL